MRDKISVLKNVFCDQVSVSEDGGRMHSRILWSIRQGELRWWFYNKLFIYNSSILYFVHYIERLIRHFKNWKAWRRILPWYCNLLLTLWLQILAGMGRGLAILSVLLLATIIGASCDDGFWKVVPLSKRLTTWKRFGGPDHVWAACYTYLGYHVLDFAVICTDLSWAASCCSFSTVLQISTTVDVLACRMTYMSSVLLLRGPVWHIPWHHPWDWMKDV